MASEMGKFGCPLLDRHWRKIHSAKQQVDTHGDKIKMTEKNVRIEEDDDELIISLMKNRTLGIF